MSKELYYHCDNCGVKIKQENATFEIELESFQAGYKFETKVTDYNTVLCSKCYKNYQNKRNRSCYRKPDRDTSSYPDSS